MTSKLAGPTPDDQWTATDSPPGSRAARRIASLEGELRAAREQLDASERMAVLGRITAGIAHEINSPLGGVLNAVRAARGFVAEYQSSVDDPEITPQDHQAIAVDILEALSTAENAAERVARFVHSIKSQTRGSAADTEFDPADEVDSTVTLLQHELKRRQLTVSTDLERGLRLHGDPTKFGIVVQNLLANALDAYDAGPGEVRIRLDSDGGRLRLRVEDQGCGIPEELRGRIFEYLFTTKDHGKGTGIGLAMVQGLITRSFRGEISLESEVGRGTTFTVLIPFTADETENGA